MRTKYVDGVYQLTPEQKSRLAEMFNSPRGFLHFYPEDVVYVINGQPITKGDILENKRKRQRRLLANKRRLTEPVIKPCFIWVFFCPGLGGWVYRGWWLYIKALHHEWSLDFRRFSERLILKTMELYPCGLLPITENFELWKETFAQVYHYPTRKRPENQGMAQAWAKISPDGDLLDIYKQGA